MLSSFKQFVTSEKLFSPEETILLTVSGGIDSITLCELFHQAGYKFAIAHCNFKLRGHESDRDEQFVRTLSEKYNVIFHCKHFDTEKYSQEKGISIQMAARNIRYQWFAELLTMHSYAFAATGHHRDDSIETVFINLIRGTGIRGIRGMLSAHQRFIHPLLFASRNEIVTFCKENDLKYCDDSTNAHAKYERNKIRLELIPVLRQLSENFDSTMLKNMQRFRETEMALQFVIENAKEKLIIEKNGIIIISIQELKKLQPVHFYLYELLSQYGFNESVIEDVAQSLDSISGKQFFSSSYRLIKNREQLLISPLGKELPKQQPVKILKRNNVTLNYPFKLSLKIIPNRKGVVFENNPNIAYLDCNKLRFPLHLRKWENGDYFFPIGMECRKKLSDLFVDLKLSLLEKENIYLLCSKNSIVWVVGKRIDNRFKITENTKQILRLELI